MKKIVCLLTLFLMLFIVGCNDNKTPTKEDVLDKIILDDKEVINDFILPSNITVNDITYELTWESNSKEIEIINENDQYKAIIKPSEIEKNVILTVKLKVDDEEVSKTFEVIVKALEKEYTANELIEKISFDNSIDYDYDFIVPKTLNVDSINVNIAWESNNVDVVKIVENEDEIIAEVSEVTNDTNATLKAVINYNGDVATKDFNVKIIPFNYEENLNKLEEILTNEGIVIHHYLYDSDFTMPNYLLNGEIKLDWSSSNPDVVKVENEGDITKFIVTKGDEAVVVTLTLKVTYKYISELATSFEIGILSNDMNLEEQIGTLLSEELKSLLSNNIPNIIYEEITIPSSISANGKTVNFNLESSNGDLLIIKKVDNNYIIKLSPLLLSGSVEIVYSFTYGDFVYENKIERDVKGLTTTIDSIILYKSSAGMTYRKDGATTLLNGNIYQKGDLLPMWEELEKEFSVEFSDVADYACNSIRDSINSYINNDYRGINGEFVELLMATNENIEELYRLNKLLSLSDHLDKMPNFKKFLDDNPAIAAQLKQDDGKIYNTPYFNGANNLEKNLMINADYVKRLLDDEYSINNMDITANMTENLGNIYTAFYPNVSGQVVKVANYDCSGTYDLIIGTAKEGKNAIEIQNNLKTKNGLTLVEALRNYIDQAYRYNDELKQLYPNRSDIFLSASACYNVDDMIALWRCIKANPSYLTNGEYNNIEVFFPRSGQSNRQKDVLQLLEAFGVRGMSSESDYLYFANDGLLHDARIEEDTYKALQKLNEIYQEGLIVPNYQSGAGGQTKNEWRSYLLANGTGVVSYDYVSTTASYVGEDSKSSSYTVILPPVAKWDVDHDPNYESLNSNYFHFSESLEGLKSGGFCIPSNNDYYDIDQLFIILDYMFTDEGSDLANYGPNTIDYRAEVTLYDDNRNRVSNAINNPNGMISIAGEDYIKISDKLLEDIEKNNINYKDYYQRYVGCQFPIGYNFSYGLSYQFLTPSLQNGINNVKKAINCGGMYTLNISDTSSFYSAVPLKFDITPEEQMNIDAYCKYFADCWKEDSATNVCGYTKFITNSSSITDEAIAYILSVENVDPIRIYYLAYYQKAYDKSIE